MASRTSRSPGDAGIHARPIFRHLLEHGDVTSRDAGGRAVITLTVDDWLLERLLTFDAGSEDLEDNGDAGRTTTRRRTTRLAEPASVTRDNQTGSAGASLPR
jgi:hypothetical protein